MLPNCRLPSGTCYVVTVCDAWDFHVHSHQWNELADSIAALASRGHQYNPCDGRMRGLVAERASLQWVFLAHLPCAARRQYPECAGIVDAPGLALPPGVIAARVDGCAMRPPEANKTESEELLVCSYNALSLIRLRTKQLSWPRPLAPVDVI